jgi:competence protein ComEA
VGTGSPERSGTSLRGGIELTRTGALALLVLASAGAGTLRVRHWPDSRPALDCPPDAIGWSDAGATPFARCQAGGPVPPDQAVALGRPVELNRVPEETLARLPGIGARVAHDLVVARSRAPFRDWEAVDAVPGVGPARLATLRRFTRLEP